MTKDYVNEKLELIKKLMEIKHEFHQLPLKKTGKNSYRNYKYFKLEDFIPQVEALCYNHKVYTLYELKTDEYGSTLHLTATDCDTGFSKSIAQMRLPTNINSNINDCCQDEGKIRKYMRRYLWGDALDLVEDDEVEVTAGMKQVQKKKAKPKKVTGSSEKISREECERLKRFAQEVQKELQSRGLNPNKIEIMEQGLNKYVISKDITVSQKQYILGLMTA